MAEHNDLGLRGEQLAVEHLLSRGYDILERNYRHGKIEVDIIAKIKNVLAVVEVKTRSSKVFGNPQDFISNKQISNIASAINEYLVKNDLDLEVRFDVIAITMYGQKTELTHLKDAFYHF